MTFRYWLMGILANPISRSMLEDASNGKPSELAVWLIELTVLTEDTETLQQRAK